MKTPITYYGGKQTMLKHILPLLPPHKLYVEPFFGGGSVFFAKPPSDVEVINDKLDAAIAFYRMAQTRFDELKKEIDCCLYSRTLQRKANLICMGRTEATDMEKAAAFWAATQMSFSAKIDGGFKFNKEMNYAKILDAKRRNFTEEIKKRLRETAIENLDALEIIRKYDCPHAFFYIDPPYYQADMGHYAGYTQSDFENLLETLCGIDGKFLLSCYECEILDLYRNENDWKTVAIECNVRAINRKKEQARKKSECLTFNYRLEENLFGY